MWSVQERDGTRRTTTDDDSRVQVVVTGARGSEVSCRRHREGEGDDVTSQNQHHPVSWLLRRRGSVGVLPFPFSAWPRETVFVFVPSHLARSRLGPSPVPSKHNHSVRPCKAMGLSKSKPPSSGSKREKDPCRCHCRCRMAVLRGKKIVHSLRMCDQDR